MSDEQSASKAGKPSQDAISYTESPPTSIPGILRRLGPGLIIAGSIVGSGELIATTATGAQAGFVLLWLILIGCVIKVFVQVELGRYAITSGRKTMQALTEVPGPSWPGHGNWLTWYWLVMFGASVAQLGGIVGGVGQALAISAPLSEYGKQYSHFAEAETQRVVVLAQLNHPAAQGNESETELLQEHTKLVRDAAAALAALEQTSDQTEDTPTQIRELDSLRNRLESPSELSMDAQQLLVAAQPVVELDNQIIPLEKEQQEEALSAEKTQELEALRKERTSQFEQLRSEFPGNQNQLLLENYLAVQAIPRPDAPRDDKIWATLVTAVTVVILVMGRYGLIQSFSTAMVGLFTLITIVNLFLLQSTEVWRVDLADIITGMRFRLPEGGNFSAISTALATFGIIGVGASELIAYPYWCLEKGYGRFTGPRDDSSEWAERARGWMRVMRWDAWCSMAVYTFATIAFYLLGAAILEPTGLDPKGPEMIRYLSVMYEPVFGSVARTLFLFGAFAVLYSTFFVANAGNARVFSDVLAVLGLARSGDKAHVARSRILSGLLPIACTACYWTGWEPQAMVLLSGLMQAIMLPMLAGAALYFRYFKADMRVRPGPVWDVFLWISAVGLLIAGVWAIYSKIS